MNYKNRNRAISDFIIISHNTITHGHVGLYENLVLTHSEIGSHVEPLKEGGVINFFKK